MADTAPAQPVARGSLVRFGAEVVWAGLSLLSGAIVAQQLGADGKGFSASVGYLVGLMGPLCALGLGEAGIYLLRTHRADERTVVTNSLAILAVSLPIGAALLVLIALAEFRSALPTLDGSIAAAVLTLPFFATYHILSTLSDARGRLVAASLAKVAVGATTLFFVALLVLKGGRGVFGAVAASGLAYVLGSVVLGVAAVWRSGRPRVVALRRDYWRPALAIGVPSALGLLLVSASSRADLLLVQSLKGGREAGLYSVSLTVSQLVAYAPIALSAATFGGTAALGDAASPYVERVFRMSFLVSVGLAIALGLLLPELIPTAFGPGFRPAVGTAAALLPGGVLYGQQWVMCRSLAARGFPRIQLASFGATLVVMGAADIVLIPAFARSGAVVAATLGSVVGLGVAVVGHLRCPGARGPLHLLPRWGDVAQLGHSLRALRLNP